MVFVFVENDEEVLDLDEERRAKGFKSDWEGCAKGLKRRLLVGACVRSEG